MRRPSSINKKVLFLALIVGLLVQIPLLELLHRQTLSDGVPSTQTRQKTLRTRLAPMKRKKKEEKKVATPKGIIVDVKPPKEEVKEKKDAKFLSEHATRTKKETKARKRSHSKSKRTGEVRVEKASPAQSEDSNSKAPTKLAKPTEETLVPPPTPKMPTTAEGQAPRVDALQKPRKLPLFLPATSEENADSNIQATSGMFTSNDALLDIQVEADETSLNSKRFRFAYYFNRIKNRVSDHWEPARTYRNRDPTGRILGVKDRLTVLRVTLDSEGRIKRVATAKQSGASFLDEEAARAFAASGPFPNPPEGLVDENGEITFRFGFLFEISNKPSFFWKR